MRSGDDASDRAAPLHIVRPERGSPHNLPARLTSFVGRGRELAEIRELFASTRLLSLIGSGGAGKTRLAVEFGETALDGAPDGAWLVELAPLSDGSLILPEIADVFELREQPGIPLMDVVTAYLAERRLLLVVDNCEHLLEPCAEIVERILASCSDIRILATSREPLRVPSEVVLRVPPLAIPEGEGSADPASVAAFDAVQLFAQRAASAAPGFDLTESNARDVAILCARLDGLPFAIELAASRVAVFPVSTIVQRLSDRFEILVGGSRTALSRQQTLHATLDWSYALLDEPERLLLRRLSVFAGGISLDAAEGICSEPQDGTSPIIRVLGQLVDKSLVVLDDGGPEPRYRLLETVREYGLERLTESGERQRVEGRHGEWFTGFAAEAVRALPRPDRGRWLDGLDAEHDNIRIALERGFAGDPERALRICGVMWHYWLWRAYLTEGRRWLEDALAAVPGRTEHQAAALLGAGVLSLRAGLAREGIALVEEALTIYEELGDVRSSCWALQAMAVPDFVRDERARAEMRYRASLALAEQGGFDAGRAAATQGLGLISWHGGLRDEGERLLEESLELFRSLSRLDEEAPPLHDLGEFVVSEPGTGVPRIVFQETFSSFQSVPCATAVGHVLANLGMIARAEGDLDLARARLEEALDVFEGLGDERAVGHALGRLGNLATAEGDYVRARDLLERSIEIRRRIRDWRGMTLAESNLGYLATVQGDLDDAHRILERTTDTFLRRGDRWGYAGSLGNLASLALAEGDREEARRLIQKSLLTIDEIGIPRWRGWALLQLGAIERLRGDEDRAEAHVHEALDIFERLDLARGAQQARAFLSRSSQRGLATVLFGDIVGSTATATELGNRSWRDLVERFLSVVRDTLGGFGGREVDTAGDGFLAVFEGPSQAIACAAAIERGVRRLGLSIRAGVHTGEIERVGDAVRGIAVHIGARASALAGPGEIVVTRTVRDLLLGSTIGFEARGTHALKGVPGEWELFSVAGDVPVD